MGLVIARPVVPPRPVGVGVDKDGQARLVSVQAVFSQLPVVGLGIAVLSGVGPPGEGKRAPLGSGRAGISKTAPYP